MMDCFRVTSIAYHKDGFTIFTGVPIEQQGFKVTDGKYIVTVKAQQGLLPASPAIGQHWQVCGTMLVDELTQGDFKLKQHTYTALTHVECTLPASGEQLIKFIAKERDFIGIGDQKARLLWQTLGTQFHSVVNNDNEANRAALKTMLTNQSIDALFKGYAKYRNLSAYNWLTQYQVPAPVQQRLIKYHDDKSIDAIKANPYTLLCFGMSFSDVDRLAVDRFNVAPEDNRRLSAAVEMAIKAEVGKGHTYTKQQDIRAYVRKLLTSDELATKAFMLGYNTSQFLLNKDTGTYHPTAQILMESVVVKRFLKLKTSTNLMDETTNHAFIEARDELAYELTSKQQEAVLTSLDNAISCITGGAGTGKTTVLRTALKAYHKAGSTIYAVALSGRAAMRLHESIGFKTSTIAAFLKEPPVGPAPNEADHVLVIDEASMIDLPTMYRLVTSIDPNIRIIFTGDPNQLPPIGCGKVLADVVDSGVIANTELDIVKRQEGATGIPEYSALINDGEVPERLSTGTITFHETAKANIAEKCTALFTLSPQNSCIMGSTRAIVADINKRCQTVVNPDGQHMEFTINGERFFRDLRLGDALLFTQNNYDMGIQNGSLGVLTSVEATVQSYGTVELDTGVQVAITQSILDSIELGYCITLHKAQGSQFPRVIVALQKGRITDRAWLYTAITRAENEIHIVGSANDFAAITKATSNAHKRNSHLINLLQQNR